LSVNEQPPLVVLVTGPIAAGKTSTALALAKRRRRAGHKAASIDMDEMMTMVAGPDGVIMTPEDWDAAGDVTAAVIDRLGESGTEFVFVSGPFFGLRNRRVVLENLHIKARVSCVVLEVELEETIRRAGKDGKRSLTKDPDLIRDIYATIDWEALPPDSVRINASALEVEAVVSKIERLLKIS
jgi:adenylylsulfate kinase-like enzyme